MSAIFFSPSHRQGRSSRFWVGAVAVWSIALAATLPLTESGCERPTVPKPSQNRKKEQEV